MSKRLLKDNPLILFNIWDAGSAKAMHEIRVKAIATSSWSAASSHGYKDGKKYRLIQFHRKKMIQSY